MYIRSPFWRTMLKNLTSSFSMSSIPLRTKREDAIARPAGGAKFHRAQRREFFSKPVKFGVVFAVKKKSARRPKPLMGALCSRPDAEAERPAPAASRTAEAPPVTLQKPGSSSSQTVGASSSFSSPSRAPAAPVAPTVWTKAALSTRYTPMEKLGAGAFGVVMRVISKEAGREFADKVMKRAEAEAAGKLDRLLREIEIWQKPTHPNILRLIEVVETADELHLITEICRGGELFDQLDAVDTFSEHECRLVVAQIAGAVAHLHLAHGIAHCDIKPQNILCRSSQVTDAGCIKLSDFGAAQLFAAGAADAFVETCGTLEYYAPELCENRASAAATSARRRRTAPPSTCGRWAAWRTNCCAASRRFGARTTASRCVSSSRTTSRSPTSASPPSPRRRRS